MVNYDREILRVLVEAGSEGLPVRKISRHVHHACNSFFDEIDFDELHHYVSQFLLRNSKNPESLIEKTDRGVYHLNMKNTQTQQLMLEFKEQPQEEPTEAPVKDLSLGLFDE